MHITIIGAGIGGLTLGLALHRLGISCDIYESNAELKPVGVGINILPHASQFLCKDLGLEEDLSKLAVLTQESIFFNRFGQKIYSEPAGKFAGYDYPQFSIHRHDLLQTLLNAYLLRVGSEHLHLGYAALSVDASKGTTTFQIKQSGEILEITSDCVVACDGLHSVIRKQLHPNEGAPKYSGVNMWRGVTRAPAFLTGASMVRAGWLTHGKMVIYPIRNQIDTAGNQLINWVAEIETPKHLKRDWNKKGHLDDFIGAFEDWQFDWLDVPALMRNADTILEFPMIDQDPLPFWTKELTTLLGDAAHPMYPRGSNGAGQSILDARCLAELLAQDQPVSQALIAYEKKRLSETAQVVLANRINPPDAILREVYERSSDQPFDQIDNIISAQELSQISNNYKKITGSDPASLGR